MKCVHCGSDRVHSKGLRETKAGQVRQYKCVDAGCGKYFSLPVLDIDLSDDDLTETFVRDQAWIDQKLKAKTFVITAMQSNVGVDDIFWKCLQQYANHKKAEILLLPVKHSSGAGSTRTHTYEAAFHDYLVDNNFKLHEKLKVLGALKVNATAENPLTGLTAISKGDSVIVGHNQLQMTTLPVNQDDCPVIMTSTGTISEKQYSATKAGYKAGFNHSNSAVVVELDGENFHIRHLNFDGTGFYDLDTHYTEIGWRTDTIEALVTGDEHAIFADPDVKKATYTAKDSIVKTLKPKTIVRHDLLDCYSVSHHHKDDVFTQYAKYTGEANVIEAELQETLMYVRDTTPDHTENLIVSSNHNDHLTRWLKECDPKVEPWNAKFYHWMMFQMLDRTKMGEAGAEYPNPFQLYAENTTTAYGMKLKFLGRREIHKILDIEIANHGDRGANGARGSRKQFAQVPSKTIIGHSHSPGIEKGCYQVGTSSRLNLDYNVGPSSWMNTHCLIHKNGKRQLINIINGKWRR
jgi:hypothetical protein